MLNGQVKSYRDAMAELQEIVGRLRQTDDVDVDELVQDVERARKLSDFCADKIRRADVQVRGILQDLQDHNSVPAPDGEPHKSDIPF